MKKKNPYKTPFIIKFETFKRVQVDIEVKADDKNFMHKKIEF